MKEGADTQAYLMEHSRGAVHDCYLQKCLCQTCKKIIQHILTAPCQLSRKTFWEIDHIFSYSQEVCSFCTHPLNPKPIVFFTFYKLANCLIASQIRIMWTILPPTAENEITFFYPHLCNGNETEQYYLVPPLDTSQTMSMGRRNPTEVSN